jgi:hypothetical protein
MSGYSSKKAVRDIIQETLVQNGHNPADFNIAGIARDAFYYRGPGYGWGASDVTEWEQALIKHRRTTTRPAPAPTGQEDRLREELRQAREEIARLNSELSTARAAGHNSHVTSVSEQRRRELVGIPVTLNGEPARISGSRLPFASVTQAKGGLSAEWSWESVEHVVTACGGAFRTD